MAQRVMVPVVGKFHDVGMAMNTRRVNNRMPRHLPDKWKHDHVVSFPRPIQEKRGNRSFSASSSCSSWSERCATAIAVSEARVIGLSTKLLTRVGQRMHRKTTNFSTLSFLIRRRSHLTANEIPLFGVHANEIRLVGVQANETRLIGVRIEDAERKQQPAIPRLLVTISLTSYSQPRRRRSRGTGSSGPGLHVHVARWAVHGTSESSSHVNATEEEENGGEKNDRNNKVRDAYYETDQKTERGEGRREEEEEEEGWKSISALKDERSSAMAGGRNKSWLWRLQPRREELQGERANEVVGNADQPRESVTDYARRAMEESVPPEGSVLLLSCLVGIMTGVAVVLFNNTVHGIHDWLWSGAGGEGAAWVRSQPLSATWVRVVAIPIGGGLLVGALNSLRTSVDETNISYEEDVSQGGENPHVRHPNLYLLPIAKPFLKALAAAVTLGTGNSLGPEGPSVEIGASLASGVGLVLKNSRERTLAFIAAGSAAGISSGFNAAVAGTFFAVESVLRSSLSADATPSLTTAMILLSSVLASVVSRIGLGSDPAFNVPAYEFRSFAELPLYLLLGVLCGGVSVALTRTVSVTTDSFEALQKETNINPAFLPAIGGLFVGLIGLIYPEVLYNGFENVDALLTSRPFPTAPSPELALQLVGAKIVATALCRGSGQVGGIYAPSLFIGAALGSSYGNFVSSFLASADPANQFNLMSVAAPQAYALVGMAATLAGVCQVPLTSVLLLFELTQDYRIILPLMGAVGISSWISSVAQKSTSKRVLRRASASTDPLPASAGSESSSSVEQQQPLWIEALNLKTLSSIGVESLQALKLWGSRSVVFPEMAVSESSDSTEPSSVEGRGKQSKAEEEEEEEDGEEICRLDSSLCVSEVDVTEEELMEEIFVSVAMRTRFLSIKGDTSVGSAVSLMLSEKEWCAIVLNNDGFLQGIVTLADVQGEAQRARSDRKGQSKQDLSSRPISTIASGQPGRSGRRRSDSVVTCYPDLSLRAAQRLMALRGLRQLPVVARAVSGEGKMDGSIKTSSVPSETVECARLRVIGLLDRESLPLACRAELTRRVLNLMPPPASDARRPPED